LRWDATKFIRTVDGTTSTELPDAIAFLRDANAIIDSEAPDALMIADRTPLDDAFFVAPPELKNFVNVLNQPFVKGGNVTLLALEPGEYVFYTVPGSGAVAQGQCLCMGSVGFTAEAGKIVSVGRMVGMEGREFRFVAADDKFEAPAMLKPYNVSPAKLVAVGKLPNFFGAIVTRVAPVPGLLAYKRDIPLGGGDQEAVGLN